MHGFGMITGSAGEKLLGQFKENDLTGYGLFVGPDGAKYAGQFLRNELSGQGIAVGANGERAEGVFRNGQLAEAKQITDAKILALLNTPPEYDSVFAVLGNASAGSQTASTKSDATTPEAAKTEAPKAPAVTYDTSKIYYFINGLGGPSGTCVSEKWGKDYARSPKDGIPYWGMRYAQQNEGRSKPGMPDDYFEASVVPTNIETMSPERLDRCSYLIATGEELNNNPTFNVLSNKTTTEWKLRKSLSIAETEKIWLTALGFRSRADYDNASTINFTMSGSTYDSLAKYGVTNMDKFSQAQERLKAINCQGAYAYLEGMIEFLTDEAQSIKTKTSIDKFCAKRVAAANKEKAKEQEEIRKRELASPLLNCTKVNCNSGESVEVAVRDAWMRLRARGHPATADVCFDALKLVKDLRSAGRMFNAETADLPFSMCNRWLKELP